MNKERLMAFTDAVLAIIMTILVLELKKPFEISWEGLWELRASFLSYTISFFWIATMWVNLHRAWDSVIKITNKLVWISMLLLFFSSFLPYVTSLVAEDLGNSVAQIIYGITILTVTSSNVWMYNELYALPSKYLLGPLSKSYRRWMSRDVFIKVIGFILTLTIWPSAMLWSVLFSAIVLVLPRSI